MINEWIEKLTRLEDIDQVIARANSRVEAGGIFERVRDEIGIEFIVDDASLEFIPRQGPLIVVANHPTGFAEGLAVPAFLDSIRNDVFVLGHAFFDRWPSLADRMVLVNPRAGKGNGSSNAAAVVRAARRLRKGTCMIMFPAGEVARPAARGLKVEERPWRTGLAKIVRLSGATILPIHVSGTPTLLFRAASRLHPQLGVPLLFREAIKASRNPMKLRIHPPVTAKEFTQLGPAGEAVRHLRSSLLKEVQYPDPISQYPVNIRIRD